MTVCHHLFAQNKYKSLFTNLYFSVTAEKITQNNRGFFQRCEQSTKWRLFLGHPVQ